MQACYTKLESQAKYFPAFAVSIDRRLDRDVERAEGHVIGRCA
jgi:hypothetical protein